MNTLYLTVGLPASGKSTYTKKMAESGILRISVDELCEQGHREDYRKIVDKMVDENIDNTDIVIDAVFTDEFIQCYWNRKMKGRAKVVALYFDVDMRTCIDRCIIRDKKQPRNLSMIIHNNNTFAFPKLSYGYDRIILIRSEDQIS